MVERCLFELCQLLHELVIYRESFYEAIKITEDDVPEVEDMLEIYPDICCFVSKPDKNGYLQLFVCRKEFESIIKELITHKEQFFDLCKWKIKNYSHETILKILEHDSIMGVS